MPFIANNEQFTKVMTEVRKRSGYALSSADRSFFFCTEMLYSRLACKEPRAATWDMGILKNSAVEFIVGDGHPLPYFHTTVQRKLRKKTIYACGCCKRSQ